MRRGALRDNSLSIVFGALFLVTAAAQSLAGWRVEVQQAAEHGEGGVSYWTYVSSSSFGRALLENWQSEYLQFVLFILLTVWLTQLGSPESKQPGDEGLGTDEDQLVGEHAPPGAPKWAVVNDLRRSLYSMSLLIVMSTLFLLFLARPVGHRVAGLQRRGRSAWRREHLVDRLPGVGRLLGADAAELAVGVPGGRVVHDLRRVPAAARVARVEARRRATREDGRLGVAALQRREGAAAGEAVIRVQTLNEASTRRAESSTDGAAANRP